MSDDSSSALRQRLIAAIVGDGETPARLPLDDIVIELSHLLAVILAQHPKYQRASERKAAIERMAKAINLEAARLIRDGEVGTLH